MTEEGFPPINDSNFGDDGNISEDLCSELDRSVNPFEGPRAHSEFKLTENNQREEEHPAFRVFVQSPFSHSTSSKLCLDSKFLNQSKVKSSSEALQTHTQYSPSMSPFSRNEQKSSPLKQNLKNAGNPQVETLSNLKAENTLQKGNLGKDDENTRKFRPKVSNPKQFQGFVSDKKPFSEYTNTTENNAMQQTDFDDDYYTGKFVGKEEIIQRQIERFEHSKKVFEQKILKQQRLIKDRELDGCTFHPNTYKSAYRADELVMDSLYENSAKKRTLEEFLKSQEEHKKKVALKIEKIRENQECSMEEVRPPEINKKSSKLIEQKREKQRKILEEHSKSVHLDQDIFNRLYRSKSTTKYRIRGLDTATSSACDLTYSTSQCSHRPHTHRRQISSVSFHTDGRCKTRSDSLKIDLISSNLPSIHQDQNTTKHYMQLYSDAVYRKEKLEKLKSVRGVSLTNKPTISESSKVLIKARLRKDLEDATERIMIDRPSVKLNDGEFTFSFEQLKKLLVDLGFVKSKISTTQEEKIDVIWSTLSKEEEEPFYYSEEEAQKRVHFRDLLSFLEGITGVYQIVETQREDSELKLDQEVSQKATQQGLFGKFVKNVFYLSDKDVRQIKQQFQVLVMNRRDFLFQSRGNKAKVEYSFKPALSDQSRKLVEKDGKRKSDCFSRLHKGSCKCRRMKQTENELQNAMREECTFRPKISKHKKNASLQEEEIWSTLYTQAKITREEKEYRVSMRNKERMREELAECSFHPSIHRKMKSIDSSNTSRSFVSSYEEKIYQDYIQRMVKAREYNEAVKMAKEKGCTLDRVLKDQKPFEYPRKKKEIMMISPLLQFKKEESTGKWLFIADRQDSSNSPGSDPLQSEQSKEEEVQVAVDKQVQESSIFDDAILAPVTERSEGDVNGNSPEI